MTGHKFVITHAGVPLVIINGYECAGLPTDILEWYAERYAFALKDLKWSVIPEIQYSK